MKIGRRLEWDSAHRVMRHESKCSTLHGHRYVAIIEVEADELDDVDRVVDFGVVKAKVGTWIDDHWDHTTLVNELDVELRAFCDRDSSYNGKRPAYIFGAEPTAETIASELLAVSTALLTDDRVKVTKVTIFETPNCHASVTS